LRWQRFAIPEASRAGDSDSAVRLVEAPIEQSRDEVTAAHRPAGPPPTTR